MSGAERYRAYIDRVNDRDIDGVADHLASEILYNGAVIARADYQQALRDMIAAVPDLRFEVHTIVEQGDAVAVILRDTGTPVAAVHGVAPSGASFDFTEYAFYEYSGGRIASASVLVDLPTLREQLSPSRAS